MSENSGLSKSERMQPTRLLLPELSPRASRFLRYPYRRHKSKILSRSAGDTEGAPFSVRETVAQETPAILAMSLIVTDSIHVRLSVKRLHNFANS